MADQARSDSRVSPAPPPAAATRGAFSIAAFGLAIYAGTRAVGILLESTSMAAAVAQAVVAEWGVARLGVAWTERSNADAEPPTTTLATARRAGIGALVGAVVAASVALLLVTTRAASLARAEPTASVIVVSLVTAGLYAMRDELLLHGVTLRAMGDGSPVLLRVLACGVTSAAAAVGDAAPVRAVVVRGLFGIVLGALWVRDRGAWAAWGAHTAWLFGADVLLRGGLYEAQVAASSWGGGDAGPLGGAAAVVALLPFAAAAVVGTARRGDGPGARP